MKEIFIKYKILIFRTAGSIMLLLGITLYFWVTPKELTNENMTAAVNVARMEASVYGSLAVAKKASEPEGAKFVEELKNSQKKQMQYLTLLVMVLGVVFLTYSFFSKPKSDFEK